jgi:hypothetical protein
VIVWQALLLQASDHLEPDGTRFRHGIIYDLSSDPVGGQRMAMSLVIEPPDRLVDSLVEVFGSGEGLVSEMMPF